MTDRPILFSAPMIRALLAGGKTQTRRIVKPQPDWLPEVTSTRAAGGMFWPIGSLGQQCGMPVVKCPYGVAGDTLWVREAWTKVPASAYRRSEGVQQTVDPTDPDMAAIYAAGWERSIPKWKPSIHMPRWASRLTLKITDVRVERLQEISHEDAWAEGIICDIHGARKHTACSGLTRGYQKVWEAINGPGSWAANPWVWAISFEVKP